MKVIDIHTHIWGSNPLKQNTTTPDNEPENNLQQLLALLERYPDVVKMGLIPLFGGFYPTVEDIDTGNEFILDCMNRYPDKFFGYFTVNPQLTEHAVSVVKKAGASDDVAGIKIWVACRCDREEVASVAQACIDQDLPLLIHSFYKKPQPEPEEATPEHIAQLAQKYPDAQIIMAHIGMDWPLGIRAIADYENVSVDFSGSVLEQGMIEKAVAYLGAERVFFGTDLPYGSMAANLGLLYGAAISTEQRNKIAYENAIKLMKINDLQTQ